MVMTLLTILFVAGIAFLATMSFESDLIDMERQRVRDEVSMDAIGEQVGAMLRNAVAVSPGVPFGGDLERPFAKPSPTATVTGPNSPIAIGEIPGLHNFFAPIEPYSNWSTGAPQYRFRNFTDLYDMFNPPAPGTLPPYRDREVNAGDPSGVELNPGDPVPVDSDGDGVTDTYQFDVVGDLGFSPAALTALGRSLNPRVNPDGRVFLGARVIAHGGMVNLNESHPNLIANVFDFFREPTTGVRALDLAALQSNGDINYDYFRHSPTNRNNRQVLYSPWVEESLLRHRNLLPPRGLPQTLLHGNPTTNRLTAGTSRYGDADMPGHLFPPLGTGSTGTWNFETGHADNHRYRPFVYRPTVNPPTGDFFADHVTAADGSPYPLWGLRMEPITAYAADNNGSAIQPYVRNYDRRHLVTTISHSDLLTRGAVAQVRIDPAQPPVATNLAEQDVLELMRQVNRYNFDPTSWCLTAADPLPFEYADYPHTIVNNSCVCRNDPGCNLDVRKGRLQLSLPWLDDRFAEADALMSTNPAAGIRLRDQMMRLVYDVFYLLVHNARGTHWDEIDCSPAPAGTSGACPQGEQCDNARPGLGVADFLCHDIVTGLTHREHLLTRTAASLTANLIDYMDCDGPGCVSVPPVDAFIPTRVALRRMDLQNVGRNACQGGLYIGYFCNSNADCGGGGGSCTPMIELLGRDLDLNPPGSPSGPQQLFVYGLERQPYLTEVVTCVDGSRALVGRAVEAFNPYDVPILSDADSDGVTDYWLVEVNNTVSPPTTNRIPLGTDLASERFTGFTTGTCTPVFPATSPTNPMLATSLPLTFENNWEVYLVRQLRYPNPANPSMLITVDIVMDQIRIQGDCIGEHDVGLLVPPCEAPGAAVMERIVQQSKRWTVPVPNWTELPLGSAFTLANWNSRPNNSPPTTVLPVEVEFADTQSFTRPHPLDADTDPSNDLLAGVAFPTTGSMLMLMRHANRDFSELTATPPRQPVRDLAFTTWLDVAEGAIDPGTGPTIRSVSEEIQVDNGRMPVFDLGEPLPSGGRLYAHHLDPAVTPLDVPGGLETLPWGQLVFDYFTALPLAGKGPYWNPDGIRDPSAIGAPESQPRVDLKGLRVHGQINLNAAPWKVVAGLPMVPADRVPIPFRDRVRQAAELPRYCLGGSNDGLPCVNNGGCSGGECRESAGVLGEPLAQAIVAYRELHFIADPVSGALTGNYDYDAGTGGGHGWQHPQPKARRGTGFLTVGELLNVRHPSATTATDPVTGAMVSKSRIDNFALDRATGSPPTVNPDYVEAIAKLVALGDWVTVRSHVFTVYGTLRGEYDPRLPRSTPQEWFDAARDVDSRAIRFQETVDRLPMFLGRPSPERIGERQVTRYMDVQND